MNPQYPSLTRRVVGIVCGAVAAASGMFAVYFSVMIISLMIGDLKLSDRGNWSLNEFTSVILLFIVSALAVMAVVFGALCGRLLRKRPVTP